MPIIHTPDGKTIKFPDTMKMEEIQGILDKEYSKLASGSNEQNESNEPSETRFSGEDKRQQYIVGEPTARDMFNTYGRPTLEALGLGTGAVVGAGAVPGLWSPATGVAGAAGGYAISKKVADITEGFLSLFEKQMPGMTPSESNLKQQMLGSLRDLRDGAMIQMMGEIGGRVIIDPIKKALAPFAEKFAAEGGQYLKESAAKLGIKLSPAELTNSKGLGLVESAFQKSPASADIGRDWITENQVLPLMRQRDELLANPNATGADLSHISRQIHDSLTKYVAQRTKLKDTALETLVAKVEGEVGLNHNFYDLGMTEQARLAANSATANAAKNKLYSDVGQAIPKDPSGKPIGFETPNLNQTAKNLINEGRQLPSMDAKVQTYLKWAQGEVPLSPELLDQLSAVPLEVRDQILSQMKAENPELFAKKLQWDSLQTAQKRLSAMADAEDLSIQKGNPAFKNQTSPEGRVYRALANAADEDMHLIAESTGSDAKALLDTADAFFKDNVAGVYRQDVIRKMAFADPSKLVDLAFSPNGFKNVEIVKKALGQEGFYNLRDGFTSKLVGDLSNPKTLQKNLSVYGDEFLGKVYSKEELNFLKQTAESALNLAETTLPSERLAASLVKDNPSTVVDSILGSVEAKPVSKNMYKNIELMKQALPEKDFNKLGEVFYQKLFRLNQQTEMIEPVRLARTIDKYDERGVLDLFGKEQADAAREIARLGNKMANMQAITGNPSGTAQNAMTLGLFGLLIRNPVLGTVNILTLRQAAKVLYSPMGSKWLSEGFKLPAGSKEGMKASAKIIGIINSDRLSEEQDKQGQFWEGVPSQIVQKIKGE